MKNNPQSITRIKAVYNALEDLQDKVVFVGGAVVALYADRVVLDPRTTDDVDVIIEVLNYKDLTELEGKLHAKGFVNDQESGIACRYTIQGIIVDIMPTKDRSFGFDSSWYEPGFNNSLTYSIDDRHHIRILTAPYYLATKFEAFRDRGSGDGRLSQDFEDIVFILEHRSSIWNEIEESDPDVRSYLLDEIMKLLSEPHLSEWVYSHTERTTNNQSERIINSMKVLAEKMDGR